MDMTRRQMLKAASALSATCLGAPAARAAAQHELSSDKFMGVLVDLPKCIGCRRCEFACQDSAGFDPRPIETFEDKSVMSVHRRPVPDMYTTINAFDNPQDPEKPLYTKSNCLHCNHPACASACLVGAFQKRSDGPVVYDASKCMGCRYCMVACPFQIPTYEYDHALTPKVRKCNFCAHKVPTEWNVPACVNICPEEVMTYGKRSDLIELAHEKIRREPDVYIDHVYGEHEAGGTSWMYLSSRPFDELGYLKLGSSAPNELTEAIQHGVFKFFVPPIALYGLLAMIAWLSQDGAGEAPQEEDQ